MSRVTTAKTSKMWMNPPRVYALAIPRSHNTSKITKIVQSMLTPYFPERWFEAETIRLKRVD